jgi:hypothetical protein
MAYAAETRVPIANTKTEIQTLLAKHGADRFYCAEEPHRAQIGFFLGKTLIKITLPFPTGNLKPVQHDRLKRSRWRTLLMIIRAKLETVEAGISSVEEQFLSDIVTPHGSTVYEEFRPQLATMLSSGKAPTQLLIGPRRE